MTIIAFCVIMKREDFGDDIMKYELSYKRGIEALKGNHIFLAENIFKDLIKKNHNDLSARFALANLYLKIEEPYKARAVFSQIVENTSNRINYCIELGKDFIDKNDFGQASDLLEKATALLTPNLDARSYLKKLYKYTGEKDKLPKLLDEEAVINDLYFRSQFDIGNLRSGSYSKEDAKKYLNEFLSPHLPHLTNNINYYEFIRKNFDDLDFTILPSGKPSFKQLISDDVPYKPKTNSKRTVYPEELSISNRCRYLLDKKPTRGYKGKDKFTGYLIFEYGTIGVSVLEKLFVHTKNNKIRESSENATYVFPTHMTLSLSQYSKSDIISMMKTQPYIQRVVHTSNYYSNLDKKIKQVQLSNLAHNQVSPSHKKELKDLSKVINKKKSEDFER